MRARIIAVVMLALAAAAVFALLAKSPDGLNPAQVSAAAPIATGGESAAQRAELAEGDHAVRGSSLTAGETHPTREVVVASPNPATLQVPLEIVGRAVNEAREPFAGATLWFSVLSMPVSLDASDADAFLELQDGSTVRTEGDGRFRITTQRASDSKFAPWFVLRARSNVSAEDPSPETRSLVTPLDRREPRVDLGDVVLTLDPILAAGRVVLDDGSPAQNVQVRVEVPDGQGWKRDRWRLALSDANGAFSIRGRGRFTDTLLVRGHRPSDLWIEPYQGPAREDLTLIARSGPPATIAGRVHLDAGLDPGELSVQWCSDLSATGKLSVPIDARTASFVLNGLDLGPTEFSICLRRSGALVTTLRGTWARQGEPKVDPQLDPLDLRGAIHSIRAVVLDARGRPAANAQVTLFDDRTGMNAFEAATDVNGKLDVLVPRAITVLRLDKPGAKNVDVVDGATVTLQPK
jgi:hypothetical protein